MSKESSNQTKSGKLLWKLTVHFFILCFISMFIAILFFTIFSLSFEHPEIYYKIIEVVPVLAIEYWWHLVPLAIQVSIVQSNKLTCGIIILVCIGCLSYLSKELDKNRREIRNCKDRYEFYRVKF